MTKNKPVSVVLTCWAYYKLIQLIDWTFSGNGARYKNTPDGLRLQENRRKALKFINDNGYEIF